MSDHKGRPFVFICTTTSADGKLATFERKQIDLATVDSKDFRTMNKASADAVMVGGLTFLNEDPSLIVPPNVSDRFRVEGKILHDPIKVAVVTRFEVLGPSDFLDRGQSPKVIFTTSQTSAAAIDSVSGRAAVFVLGEREVDLQSALKVLNEKFGVERLMVEGGGTLNFGLLKRGLVDEIRVK